MQGCSICKRKYKRGSGELRKRQGFLVCKNCLKWCTYLSPASPSEKSIMDSLLAKLPHPLLPSRTAPQTPLLKEEALKVRGKA